MNRAQARLADEMWAIARMDGQCARIVHDDDDAADIRRKIRWLAARDHVRIRTARVDAAVVVARLDAAVWTDDAATMRRKLAPDR